MANLWLGQSGPLWGLGMDKKRLDYYRKKLVARREELLKNIARTGEEGRAADDDPTVDLADKAANSYTKEFLFGQCVHCQGEMQLKRLEAVPWARHCLACQEKQEQGLL